jgi:hypothetical protein
MYYMNNMIVVDNICGLFIYLDFTYLNWYHDINILH